MRFLPFENITYKTNLSSEEVLRILQENIEPKKAFKVSHLFGVKNNKRYDGRIHNQTFRITRIIGYRNSFLPIISGTVAERFNKTEIKVKMRLHVLVLVFMMIWCGGVGVAFVAILVSSIKNGAIESTLLFPFLMLTFGYIMTTGGFKYESNKSKKFLAELLKAKIQKKQSSSSRHR